MHDILLIHMRERYNDITHILPTRRISVFRHFFFPFFFFKLFYHLPLFMTLRSEDSMINRVGLNYFMALATGVYLYVP